MNNAVLSLTPSLSAGPFLRLTGGTVSGAVTVQGVLTMASDLDHEGDSDTKIGFDTNKQTFTVGNLVALQMTNTTQDLVEIGDVAGGGDWDINFNNGQMFFEGSSERLGIGTTSPTGIGTGAACHVQVSGDLFPAFKMERISGSSFTDREWAFGVASAGDYFIQDATTGANRFIVDLNGLISIGPGHTPEGSLHGYTSINDVGWMWTSASGVNATPTVLKVNGTRDVVRIMSYETIAWDGGVSEFHTGNLTPATEVEIFNDATDIFKLRVNADGSVDVRRTAGASTLTVGLKIMWI